MRIRYKLFSLVILFFFIESSIAQTVSSFDSTTSLLKIPEVIVDGTTTYSVELKYTSGIAFDLYSADELKIYSYRNPAPVEYEDLANELIARE